MTARITASCPRCGTQELASTALHLTVYDAGNLDFYEFFCPGCYEHIRKPAPPEIQALLTNADVEHTFEHVPLELLEVHTGPALTVDDLMDFTIELRRNPHLRVVQGT